jgi:hypothetical protein
VVDCRYSIDEGECRVKGAHPYATTLTGFLPLYTSSYKENEELLVIFMGDSSNAYELRYLTHLICGQ